MEHREREPMSAAAGAGEAHAAISANPSKGEGSSGKYHTQQPGPGSSRHREDRDGLLGGIRGRAEEVRDRLESRVGSTLDRASDAIEGSAAFRLLERHPMAGLALAFGLGFALAGYDQPGEGRRHSMMRAAKHQLRGALLGGLSATLAHEASSFLGSESGEGGGLGNLVGSLFGEGRGAAGTRTAGGF